MFLRGLVPPYRILNSKDLPVCFRLVRCSPRLRVPSTSIPGPFRNSESGHLAFPKITVLPTRPLVVGLYLEHLIESDTSSSVLPSASCSISWANKLYGFPDPCQDPLVKNILKAGVRNSAKPVVQKEPITSDMANEDDVAEERNPGNKVEPGDQLWGRESLFFVIFSGNRAREFAGTHPNVCVKRKNNACNYVVKERRGVFPRTGRIRNSFLHSRIARTISAP